MIRFDIIESKKFRAIQRRNKVEAVTNLSGFFNLKIMDYNKFLETKKKSFISSGFELDENELNSNLFEFQKYIVKTALQKGRFAIFADCGLGKTLMQLSFADAVSKKTNMPALILAPLAVTKQTEREGKKFGINMKVMDVTNYEQLKNIDTSKYSCVILDESSILKGRDGKLSN
jgi:superfamily II DNA or RNA helicase